jgi:phospholipid/cholesterol/gamma-HCH transport system ATP-binding protein
MDKIILENLHKSFDGNNVLIDLNLDVREGETLVIIGRSGCGKSVLLKHIMGVMRPDSGRVIVEGTDITGLEGKELNEIRMKFGMLFQGAALFDSLSVAENVGFELIEHTRLEKRLVDRRVKDCLEMVGLRGIEDLKPAQLSGGMKKRVGLARAICMNPQVILYDEPTTGVDPIMGDAINELIRELNARLGVTSIVVTHDMRSAYKVGQRIAMLYKGQIIESGTPDEIRNTNNPIVRQFITGAATGPITQEEHE